MADPMTVRFRRLRSRATDLFVAGPHGQLIAVDVSSGRERWRHDLAKEFDATMPTWGFAASPLDRRAARDCAYWRG
jgi:hypothetical protein